MEHIYVKGSRILAPLVGGSDLSFRLLSRKYGANVTVTEMCVAEYYLNRDEKQVKKYVYEFDPTDRPLILQLAGNTPEPIIEMANMKMFENNIDALELNLGCPQNFALSKGYGCALLKDVNYLEDFCKKIVQGVGNKYPVCVKLRLNESVEYTIDLLKRLFNVGVQSFTLHARFPWQRGELRGRADWSALKRIQDTFDQMDYSSSSDNTLPLKKKPLIFGNGDAYTWSDGERMLNETGVFGVMSGYGALLNPMLAFCPPFELEKFLHGQKSIHNIESPSSSSNSNNNNHNNNTNNNIIHIDTTNDNNNINTQINHTNDNDTETNSINNDDKNTFESKDDSIQPSTVLDDQSEFSSSSSSVNTVTESSSSSSLSKSLLSRITAQVISDYLHIARLHINRLIDVQRHIAWILKRHGISVKEKQDLFLCKNLDDICKVLSSLSKPLIISLHPLNEGLIDRIEYPNSGEYMSKREKRKEDKIKKRLEKNSKKRKFQELKVVEFDEEDEKLIMG